MRRHETGEYVPRTGQCWTLLVVEDGEDKAGDAHVGVSVRWARQSMGLRERTGGSLEI